MGSNKGRRENDRVFREMVRPAVSVLTPVYNVERFLPECLDSLKRQTLKNIEFVCINDGSTDGSLEILRAYADKDARFRIIEQPNSGYGASMNRGLDAARGEYVGIVESDDFAEPDMFKKLYRFAKKHDCDLVKSSYFEHSESSDIKMRPFDGYPYRKVFDPRSIPTVMRVIPTIWAGLYRKDMLDSCGIRFNETPGASFQDTSFVQKVWLSARRVAVLKKAFLHYRVDNSGSSVKSSTKIYEVCGEYASTEEFMRRDPAMLEVFCSAFAAMKFDAYRWNYERIAEEYRPDFARRWAKEMKAAKDEGWLDESLFESRDREDLSRLLADPVAFCDNRKGDA